MFSLMEPWETIEYEEICPSMLNCELHISLLGDINILFNNSFIMDSNKISNVS